MDNEFDCLIPQSNGVSICNLLNELAEENNELKKQIKNSIQKADNIKCDCNPCVVEKGDWGLFIGLTMLFIVGVVLPYLFSTWSGY